jgi:hypothetical protein
MSPRQIRDVGKELFRDCSLPSFTDACKLDQGPMKAPGSTQNWDTSTGCDLTDYLKSP